MKQFIQKAVRILTVAVAAAGLPLAAYGAWFQTEHFKWVPLYHCVLCAAAALTGAYFMMQYLEESFASKKAGAMATKNGRRSALQGILLMFFCGMLVLYFCTNLPAFYVGLIVMLFGWSSALFHLILPKILKKKAEKSEA